MKSCLILCFLDCNCDIDGTEGELCCTEAGQCQCKPQYDGDKCDQCSQNHYDFPNCKECDCFEEGTDSCNMDNGFCNCRSGYVGNKCQNKGCDENDLACKFKTLEAKFMVRIEKCVLDF